MKVTKYYVLYADILGYTDKLQKCSSKSEDSFLKKILAVLKQAKQKNWTMFSIIFFTDCVFVGIKCSQKDALKKLCHYAARLEELVIRKESLLLRGGIVKGMAYFKENFAFGDAIAKAARVEKETNFPAIKLDKETLKRCKYYKKSLHTLYNFKNEKYINFLNYYSPDINKHNKREKHEKALKKSFSSIFSCLKESEENTSKDSEEKKRLKEKEDWLKEYLKTYGEKYNFDFLEF